MRVCFGGEGLLFRGEIVNFGRGAGKFRRRKRQDRALLASWREGKGKLSHLGILAKLTFDWKALSLSPPQKSSKTRV
jgi:hypothetical protein